MAKFSSKTQVDNGLNMVSDISEDGKAATVTFEDLSVGFEKKVGADKKNTGNLTSHKVFAVTLHTSDLSEDLPIGQSITGYVDISGTASATLVAQLNSTTHVIDLPDSSDGGEDFVFCFDGTLLAGSDYRAVFFLLIECHSRAADVRGMLSVESLDLEMGKSCKELG